MINMVKLYGRRSTVKDVLLLSVVPGSTSSYYVPKYIRQFEKDEGPSKSERRLLRIGGGLGDLVKLSGWSYIGYLALGSLLE